jgi:hypothetical protein
MRLSWSEPEETYTERGECERGEIGSGKKGVRQAITARQNLQQKLATEGATNRFGLSDSFAESASQGMTKIALRLALP